MKKSAAKELRKSKKRAIRNKKIKANIKYLERKLKRAVEKKQKAEAEKLFKELQKKVDKAAKINVFKKNKASRKKSRWSRLLRNIGHEQAK